MSNQTDPFSTQSTQAVDLVDQPVIAPPVKPPVTEDSVNNAVNIAGQSGAIVLITFAGAGWLLAIVLFGIVQIVNVVKDNPSPPPSIQQTELPTEHKP